MSNLIKPKSIEDYGGIYSYLDDAAVKETHDGNGSAELKRNRHKGAAFCRDLFNVKSTEPIYRWWRLIDEVDNVQQR